MSAENRSRQPAGIPVGGRFATESRGRAEISLGADPVPPNADARPKFGEIDRDKRVEAMRSEIDAAMENLSNGDGWAAFLEQSAKFHRYSMNNQMLIMLQNPEATRVAGFNDWKNKHGRTVKKGEKAMWVMAPVTRRQKVTRDDGSEDTVSQFVGARPVGVFDISQTEAVAGDPRAEILNNPGIDISLLEGEAPPGMVEDLTRTITSRGFTVNYGDTGHANGHTNFQDKQVVVSDKVSPMQAAKTLAHEAAHIALGHGEEIANYHTGPGGKRPDYEVEAESVAYVISRHYGLDSTGYSFGYIDGWAKGDKDRVKATATKVVTATKEMLASIESGQQKAVA